MMEFFKRRKARKHAEEWRRHARHCLHMRSDVADPTDVAGLSQAESRLKEAARGSDIAAMERGCDEVHSAIAKVSPPKSFAGWRENLEVVVVAVAVAMAFRTYFLQPFKIPTGSMQPTLYGIHYEQREAPGLLDSMPLRSFQWLIFGSWYVEFTAQSAGRIQGPVAEQGGMFMYEVAGVPLMLPRELKPLFVSGDVVVTGQVLARGLRVTGDHLFVNRVKWNLVRPARGEVMVFRTDGIPIPNLTEKTHYIKRLCGLPDDRLSIHPPDLLVNGKRVNSPDTILRIENREPGYAGYQVAGVGAKYLSAVGDVMELGPDQYAGFGDNTRNSLDSRYWGPVPGANLVGPAWVVYWPFSRRWGAVR